MSKQEYWDAAPIMATGANYLTVFGERGPGKTYQYKKVAIDNYVKGLRKKQFAYVRRRAEEIKPGKLANFFNDITDYLEVEMKKVYPDYETFTVQPKSGVFKLFGWTEESEKIELDDFGYYFALTTARYNKSVPYPRVNTLCYDEFLVDESKGEYELNNEFSILLNLISTIKRKREDFTVFLLGNSVNRNSKILHDMGINLREIKQGEIKIYEYCDGDITNTVAVEYTKNYKQSKESESFFVFNNPREKMIRDGSFEVDEYDTISEDEIFTNYNINKKAIIFVTPECRLYGYVLSNKRETVLYITDERLRKNNDFITFLSSGETKIPWKQFVWGGRVSEKIDLLERKIMKFHNNNFIKYKNNYVGDDFRHFLHEVR